MTHSTENPGRIIRWFKLDATSSLFLTPLQQLRLAGPATPMHGSFMGVSHRWPKVVIACLATRFPYLDFTFKTIRVLGQTSNFVLNATPPEIQLDSPAQEIERESWVATPFFLLNTLKCLSDCLSPTAQQYELDRKEIDFHRHSRWLFASSLKSFFFQQNCF